MAKTNITRDQPLEWDHLFGKNPDVALPTIYGHAMGFSKELRGWYWSAIKDKKLGSRWARGISFVLATGGVVAPLIAATAASDNTKLLWTQLGVVALAVAGLVQLADKIFGWSTGWLRYIATVTAMENLTLQFELNWSAFLLARAGKVEPDDIKQLYDLGQRLRLDLDKRRAEETDAWVAEFNAGMATLNEMIKFQKDASEKAATAAKDAIESRDDQKKTGAVEVTIAQTTKPPSPVTLHLDNVKQHTFTGTTWSKLGLEPGLHTIRVVAREGSATAVEGQIAFEVAPGAVKSVKIDLG